jgi:hypothetical protein
MTTTPVSGEKAPRPPLLPSGISDVDGPDRTTREAATERADGRGTPPPAGPNRSHWKKLAFLGPLPGTGVAVGGEVATGAAAEGMSLLAGGLVFGGLILAAIPIGMARREYEARVQDAMTALGLQNAPDGLRAARAYVYAKDMFSLRRIQPDAETQDRVAREVADYVKEKPWLFESMRRGNSMAAQKLLDVFIAAEAKALRGGEQREPSQLTTTADGVTGPALVSDPAAIETTAARELYYPKVRALPEDVNLPPAGHDEHGPFWRLDDVENAVNDIAISRGSDPRRLARPDLFYKFEGGGKLTIWLLNFRPLAKERREEIEKWLDTSLELAKHGHDVTLTYDGPVWTGTSEPIPEWLTPALAGIMRKGKDPGPGGIALTRSEAVNAPRYIDALAAGAGRDLFVTQEDDGGFRLRSGQFEGAGGDQFRPRMLARAWKDGEAWRVWRYTDSPAEPSLTAARAATPPRLRVYDLPGDVDRDNTPPAGIDPNGRPFWYLDSLPAPNREPGVSSPLRFSPREDAAIDRLARLVSQPRDEVIRSLFLYGHNYRRFVERYPAWGADRDAEVWGMAQYRPSEIVESVNRALRDLGYIEGPERPPSMGLSRFTSLPHNGASLSLSGAEFAAFEQYRARQGISRYAAAKELAKIGFWAEDSRQLGERVQPVAEGPVPDDNRVQVALTDKEAILIDQYARLHNFSPSRAFRQLVLRGLAAVMR